VTEVSFADAANGTAGEGPQTFGRFYFRNTDDRLLFVVQKRNVLERQRLEPASRGAANLQLTVQVAGEHVDGALLEPHQRHDVGQHENHDQ